MTYILGSRCSDGMTLVADRRISRSQGSLSYEDKIFSDIPNVVYGASGVVGLYDKFRLAISSVVEQNKDITPSEFISTAEKIVYELNGQYIERTNGHTLELLIADAKLNYGTLQYISPRGVGEIVKSYQVIGSGEPYGAYLLKRFWRPELTMKQVAILASVILRHIQEHDLDNAVGIERGGFPQIWFAPDWSDEDNQNYKNLPAEQQEKLNTRQILGKELADIMGQADKVYSKVDGSLVETITSLASL